MGGEMATRPVVESMITSFCELYGKRENASLVNAWMEALSRYRDAEVMTAGHRAMEECQRMPTPTDLIQRIPVNQTFENVDYRITSAKCSRCGRYAMAISEPIGRPYLCRECYTGMSNQEIAAKFRALGELTNDIPTS